LSKEVQIQAKEDSNVLCKVQEVKILFRERRFEGIAEIQGESQDVLDSITKREI
jgi:hypothetical protein